MPITKGSGLPTWTREETILALDLLYRHGKPLDRHHSEVKELSNLLRSAAIHPAEKRRDRFRNPDGVALKLQNLLSALAPGRGLTSSKTDKAVVADFPRSAAGELAKVAIAIRASLAADSAEDLLSEDETFVEGAWLTARHRRRDARLRKKLLERSKNAPLKCEICGFVAPAFKRPIQESFFEAHHRIPLSQAEGMKTTRVSDMALLCACCHRFIHRLISSRRGWVDIDEARRLMHSIARG